MGCPEDEIPNYVKEEYQQRIVEKERNTADKLRTWLDEEGIMDQLLEKFISARPTATPNCSHEFLVIFTVKTTCFREELDKPAAADRMLTSDRSANPFGDLVDGYFRGNEWSDGDRALLGAAVRIRVPRSQRSFMGSWWPMGSDAWLEFQALLISCTTDAPAVQWLCPFTVLDGLSIVSPLIRLALI